MLVEPILDLAQPLLYFRLTDSDFGRDLVGRCGLQIVEFSDLPIDFPERVRLKDLFIAKSLRGMPLSSLDPVSALARST